MRHITSLLFCALLALACSAQVPQQFNYQAILRDAGGVVQANTSATLGIALLQGSATGSLVYSENHAVTTNGFGLANVAIGGGTVVNGTFASIDWSAAPYFVRTSINGVVMGTSQLLSVPYALFAETSNTPGPTGPQGPAGAVGPQGPAGATGATGPQGITGPAGSGVTILGTLNNTGQLPATGSNGDSYLINGNLYVWSSTTNTWQNVGSIQGPAGAQGTAGPTGPIGATGPQGPQGNAGSMGATGPAGATGATGPQGNVGAVGPVGPIGPAGAVGPAGSNGTTGAQGPQGAPGTNGAAGPAGATGPQGPAGAAGAAGATGPQGPTGADGAQNAWGLQGNAGTDTTENFIGTTDDVPLVFKINGQRAGLVEGNGRLTSFGYQALANGAGGDNTAIGNESMKFATGCSSNTAIGSQSLEHNSGDRNVAVGTYALNENNTGASNTAIGTYALRNASASSGNTAVGLSAMDGDVGDYNTALGYSAMFSGGTQNVGLGYKALWSSFNTGDYNIAVGGEALSGNSTGSDNIAIGRKSLLHNSAGGGNVGVGSFALTANTTGSNNVAAGNGAMQANTTGSSNTAVGNGALSASVSGTDNTALGQNALNNGLPGTGSGDTGIGSDAGYFFGSSNSTFLGYSAYPSAAGYTNAMGLGYNARPTASNVVHIGNTSVQSIKGQVGFTTYSDARFKKNVTTDVKGLAFIMKLRPVTYNVAANDLAAYLKEDMHSDKKGGFTLVTSASDREGRDAQERIRYTGFLAQEVEAAATEVDYDFSGVDKPKNAEDLYGLRYAEFVVPLVKAVQEQQALIDAQQKQIDALKEQVRELLHR